MAWELVGGLVVVLGGGVLGGEHPGVLQSSAQSVNLDLGGSAAAAADVVDVVSAAGVVEDVVPGLELMTLPSASSMISGMFSLMSLDEKLPRDPSKVLVEGFVLGVEVDFGLIPVVEE